MQINWNKLFPGAVEPEGGAAFPDMTPLVELYRGLRAAAASDEEAAAVFREIVAVGVKASRDEGAAA